jgi:hypothetical protein
MLFESKMINTKLKELFGIDVRSLAIFRVGIALILLVDLYIRVDSIKVHYSDEGVLPRDVLIEHSIEPWNLSLHLISGLWQVQFILFTVAAICAFALLVGYRTRLATILSWVLLISLHTRNPIVLQGGDILLRMLLFWAMFLPLGAYWSVDQKFKPSFLNPVFSIASLGLLLQICFVYWFSALMKTDDVWRVDGTAVWYALRIEQYVTPLGQYLLQFPNLLKFLTFATLAVESVGPFFAFSPIWTGPLRFATVVMFILFHVFMGLAMELGPFSYICIVAWLVFLPSWFWDFFKKVEFGSSWKASWLSNGIAAFFLVYVFLWNVRTLDLDSVKPYPLLPLAFLTRVDQQWNMFAPYPLKDDGWYVIPGKLRDGTEVDLYNGREPVSWQKPLLLSATYKDDRWRSYMMNLFLLEDSEVYLSSFAKYLCQAWNRSHSYEKQVLSLDIVVMTRINEVKSPNNAFEKVVLWHHSCLEAIQE